MPDKIEQDLIALSNARIYFGHMSVGDNIIEGIKDIAKDNSNIKVNIILRGDKTPLPDKFLLHSSIGKNSEPLTKCLDYKNIINNELKNQIDFALFKFCYIDIDTNTNINELFATYKKTMDDLTLAFPHITFIHVTTALRHSASGPGVWIREILGKPNNSKLANIKRNQFNNLIRKTYAGQPIFDLAASEATHPSRKIETFTYKDGNTYHNLIGDYTYDGGHLNDFGRKKVAGDFITTLAEIIRNKQAILARN